MGDLKISDTTPTFKHVFYRVIASSLHSLFVSYGVMLACFVFGMLLVAVSPRLESGIDKIVLGPYFICPVVLGLYLGHKFGSNMQRFLSRSVFMIPLIAAIDEISGIDHVSYVGETFFQYIVHNFLGTRCEATECLGPLVITGPLVASIAYAIAAEFGRKKV